MRGRKKIIVDKAEDATILSEPELMKPMGATQSPLLDPISTEASGEGTGKAKILQNLGGNQSNDAFDENDDDFESQQPEPKFRGQKKQSASFNSESVIDDNDFPEPPESNFDEPDEFDEEYEEGYNDIPEGYLDKEIPKQAKFITDLVTNLVETLILQKYAIDVDSIRASLLEVPDMQPQLPNILKGLNDYNMGFKNAIEFTKDEKKLIVTGLVNILKKYPAISDKLTGEAQLGLAILTIGLTKLGVLKQMRDKGTEILTNINATLIQYREFYKMKTEQMRNQQAQAQPQAEQSGNKRAEQYG
jgi:hypothetical protein